MNRFMELELDIQEYREEENILKIRRKKSFKYSNTKTFGTREGLANLSSFEHLLFYKVPDHIVQKLKRRKMKIQYAHNEGYTNDLNTDFYSTKITKMPTIKGRTLTSRELIKLIRLNINSFIDTKYSEFEPYSSAIDAPVWKSNNPIGAVIKIDILGPDNASVVCSYISKNGLGWGFSTIDAPATGTHPVSGHREFFISEKSDYKLFVIKGLDIGSIGIPGLGFPIGEGIGYTIADKLWKSMRTKVIKFINSNGGKATVAKTYQKETEWRFVYWKYKKQLAKVFGSGAGAP